MKFTKGFKAVCLLWIVVSVAMWNFKYFNNRYNNYLIFKYVYHHTIAEKNLYNDYPQEYGDSNHYGPVFSLLIAPFALMPDGAGLLLWNLANCGILIWAVYLLPLSVRQKTFILLFSSLEFAGAEHYIQFNAFITAFIILSFLLVDRGKDEWATLFIALGTLVKLYPIIGLAFFMFSKRKKAFALTGLAWMAVFVALPMLISSQHFVLQSYLDWYNSLHAKNLLNVDLTSSQDISIMGTVRRLTGDITIPNLPFLVAGALIFAVPLLLRSSQFKSLQFRLQVLASALLMVVLFSTGSEHPTYIIAMIGATLWIFMQEQPFTRTNIVLLVLLVVITGLGPTDAFPKVIRHAYINRYVMKAWPCIVVWAILSWQLWFKDFNAIDRKPVSEDKEVMAAPAVTEPELMLA